MLLLSRKCEKCDGERKENVSLGKGGLLLSALYDKKTDGTVSQRNWEGKVSIEWGTDFPCTVTGTLR